MVYISFIIQVLSLVLENKTEVIACGEHYSKIMLLKIPVNLLSLNDYNQSKQKVNMQPIKHVCLHYYYRMRINFYSSLEKLEILLKQMKPAL